MNNFYNPPLVAISGTYTGNDSADRAIPHGLGRTPKVVFIFAVSTGNIWHLFGTGDYLVYNTGTYFSNTAWTAVNFYVGDAGSYPNSANAVGATYTWIAI